MSWEHDKRRGNRHARGYGGDWVRLRNNILIRDDKLCQPCLKAGRDTIAKEVDHIIPKAKGGTDDPGNLQAICTDCHKAKTTRDNGGMPKTGYKVDGTPTDPDHPWNLPGA